MNCYCCSGKDFENCCYPYHSLAAVVKTAEQLMRSRYSAFVLSNAEYLLATWASEQRPKKLRLHDSAEWIGLEIISTDKGLLNDVIGQVEFKARLIQQDQLICIHEKSDFHREDGDWKYVSGELYETPVIELSMKQVCPCGSGKKYKHCCKKS